MIVSSVYFWIDDGDDSVNDVEHEILRVCVGQRVPQATR